MVTFGERLDYAQKARGLSQRQLASILDTQPESLQRYKKGIRKPKPNIVISIAEALNLPSFLFDESNYGYIKLDTQGDLLALIIDQIKKGFIFVSGDEDGTVRDGWLTLHISEGLSKFFTLTKLNLLGNEKRPGFEERLDSKTAGKQFYGLRFAKEYCAIQDALAEWYELWEAGKTEEADRLQIEIATKDEFQIPLDE